MSGKASVRLRLRRSDSLALRQMPPLPLPVLPQLPLESSSAVAADAETHGNVGDGRSPAGRRPPAGDIEEEVGACSSLEDFSIFFFMPRTSAQDAASAQTHLRPSVRGTMPSTVPSLASSMTVGQNVLRHGKPVSNFFTTRSRVR